MNSTTVLLTLCILVALTGVSRAATQKGAANPAPKTPPSVRTEKEAPAKLSGKVVETMNASGYTYVCLEKNGRKTWVAVPETKVSVGKEMAFLPGQTMKNFSSKTLNRTFEEIVFSGGPVSAEAPAASPGMPSGHPAVAGGQGEATGSKAQVTPKDANVKVEKATGANARTVAEVYAKRIELSRKQVVVKGKVIKVSEGIMGRNWIHLQDGTGSQQKGTHNLVVTSKDLAAVNDIVTISGTLTKDKDFGAGYRYKVIVEDAVIQK